MTKRKKAPTDQSDRQEFAKQLRDAREARGLSIEQLSNLACITAGRLRNWENGEGMPHISHVVLLSVALGTGVEYFLTSPPLSPNDECRFGRKLRKARVARFQTIQHAAAYCKVPKESWKAWERGHDMPLPPVLCHLAHKLGVSMDWLAGTASVKTFARHSKAMREREARMNAAYLASLQPKVA